MSKPMGPIPQEFSAGPDGVLQIAGRSTHDLASQAGGTPLFVYDAGMVADRIARFRTAFSGIGLHYAIKANSYALLLATVAKQVDGLDVASAGEMHLALAAGTQPSVRPSWAPPTSSQAPSPAPCRA